MKLSINRDSLLEKLSYSSRFTSSKLSSLTALQGVLMKSKDKQIHFYSTNLNSYYHSILKTEESHEFEIVVESKKLIEYLSLLSPGKIELEISEKDLLVIQAKTRGKFPLMNTKDFPLPPTLNNKPQIIKASVFTENLSLILFSTSSDDTRPVLTGVNFITQDENLLMVTTDGFRLSLLKLKREIDIPSMLVPSNFLAEVLHFLKGEKDLSLFYSPEEKIAKFTIGENDLYSRLIEGEYPPFERVIPAERKTTVETDREELLKNIKLISIFARDVSSIIIIKTTADGLQLQPKTEAGDQNIAFQEAKIEGEEQRIAFNYKFLLDLLNHLDSQKITIELLRSDAPAVFKTDKNPHFLHIIMPVRIQE